MPGIGRKNENYSVPDEIRKVKLYIPVCTFGDEEDEAKKNLFGEAGAIIRTVPGNHHYNYNPSAVAEAIVKEVVKSAGK